MRTRTKGPPARHAGRAPISRPTSDRTIDVSVVRDGAARQLDTAEPSIPWPLGRVGDDVDAPLDRPTAIAELGRIGGGPVLGDDRFRYIAAAAVELAPKVRSRSRRLGMLAGIDRRRCVPPIGRDRVAELELFHVPGDTDDRGTAR